uniref:Uncharacterized protein n=1 Tax=Candidatus Kentrum sp. FM TaxID=2126340 RepID=A0A450SPH0_9GAMM|nr:MAG: hypothetical protein BECKFM1743C_GA0114222_101652 [Candidatus Kentron sp. FM]VFJ56265.1 MAG: hypothetical protein BECKFM1743A_GA0114220_101656 [Candidatus Kentron sp. FM]VFK10755.1 MAG: hypothetical protein BECKFM1743B_GA0114221_101536 [Candidatus Kentron sp. FM]
MKFTRYFHYTRRRLDRASVKMEWIESVHRRPLATEFQADGRIRKWGYIDETGKYLRIVLLEDGETVHNAFFDRDFKVTIQ